MILGDRAYITLNVEDLNASLLFFQKLGFKTLDKPADSKDWALLTDDAILVLLNQAPEPFRGLTYMSADMPQRTLTLQQNGVDFEEVNSDDNNDLIQATFTAPGDIGISLLRFNPTGLPEPDLNTDTRCGVFGEFYVTVDDLEKATSFWKEIGFQTLHTTDTPYPHSILSDGHLIMGLHQTEEQQPPALSYFAPDMPMRMRGLKLEGLEFSDEFKDDSGNVHGGVVQSPDGFRVYLFEGSFADAED